MIARPRAAFTAALAIAALLIAGCSSGAADGADPTGAGDDAVTSIDGQPPAAAEPALDPVDLAIRAMVPSDDAPTAAGINKILKKPLKGEIADLAGWIVDPLTGEVLWERKASAGRVPASAMKLITAAALLASADPTDRLVTTIVKGEEDGEIVFVGGGDVTLSARPVGAPTILPGGPTVADLAEQVQESGFGPVTSIVLDTSYWTGPEMADGWNADDIRGTPNEARGYITPMQALMVDADREDPANEDSPRTGTPAITAGQALAHALGNDEIPLTEGQAPPGAEVIARVESQPLATLLAQALENSDNILSEALARQAAIARGSAPSFAGVSAAIMQALEDLGLDTTGVTIKDGSGMSGENRVPTAILGELMAIAVAGHHPEQQLLLTGLPLAGVSGTLAPPRFSQPENEVGAGWVRAKTGSLASTYALVGYVPDVDGRILVFSFNSTNVVSDADPNIGTRPALDALAAALRTCGCSG